MSFFDFDNMRKYGAFWSKLPLWLKGVSVIVAIIAIGFFFVHYQGLRQKNSDLKDEVAKLQNENRHLETMTGPIQEITKRLYPDLETVAAIARLGEDIENVRLLATRDVYKPLTKDRQEKLVNDLKALRQEYSAISPSVKISCEKGSMVRRKVGSDLEKYLKNSDWKVEISYPISFGAKKPSNFSIRYHPDDQDFLVKFFRIIATNFITGELEGRYNDKIERGHFEITIKGDPLFDESGVVSFK